MKLLMMMTAMCMATMTIPAMGATPDDDAFFEKLAQVKEELQTNSIDDLLESRSAPSPYEDILRRLDRLEATAIDAQEAEQIAERVVMTHIKAIRIAINTADGGQRIATKTFTSPTDTQGIQLNPGESLASYTDVTTGQVVQVGPPTTTVRVQRYADPVPVYQTPAVEFRSQPMPVSEVRQVYMRPNVQTYSTAPRTTTSYRRGLFGRQIPIRTTSNQTCQMVNGQMQCN
tara:strand:+ start:252 stop:941 length:690 start_codon:yes stop_codon:yes gene_type:complete